MRQRSLRLRLLITFGLGALLLSGFFAALTYEGVHHILVADLQQTDLHESYENAALVRSTLYTSPPELSKLLNSIESATNSSVLVQTDQEWLSRSHGAQTIDVPTPVIDTVLRGNAAAQILVIKGRVIFVVGVPIPAVETQFFEVFNFASLEHTLRLLMLLLATGALVTTLIGVAGGLWVTRRTVQPLEQVSLAAAAIADGNLSTRLQVNRADREVQQLT
ncbi:MAG: HAMP domain-containing protein, partial [Acidimicrobiales bacterium]